jgi:Fe-S cluster biogenesis protein NfuA/nitrite reductase/ring-hydroxylating ferredoxin subunit
VQTEHSSPELPTEFQHLLDWVGEGLQQMEGIEDENTREEVFALLEGIDVLHRQVLERLLELGGSGLVEKASQDPVAGTLLEMYELPQSEESEQEQVERALENVHPYFHSHGGKLDVLGVEDGKVRVSLSGSCKGCPGSSMTLKRVVEEALRENFPGFKELVAEEPPDEEEEPIQLGSKPDRQPRWVSVGPLEDVSPGEMRGIRPEGTPLLLVRLEDGEVYAYRDGCPPGSNLTLHLGRLEEGALVCPWHGCRYDARTGERQDGEEGGLYAFPVGLEGGEIRVAISVEGPG